MKDLEPEGGRDGTGELLRVLEALSSASRLQLLARLARPAFIAELAAGLGMSRQAVKKHLLALEEVALVEARPAWRGAVRATQYRASAAGLFAFKEALHGLALPAGGPPFPAPPTRPAAPGPAAGPRGEPGLLLVHGDVPGRWFPLSGRASWVIGRAPDDDVSLAYDPFASARHALLRREGDGWRVRDLESTNGTRVNLQPLPSGGTRPLAPGDLLTVGHSHLLLREGL